VADLFELLLMEAYPASLNVALDVML